MTSGNGTAPAPTLEDRVAKLEGDVRTLAQTSLDAIEANRAGLLEIAGHVQQVPLAGEVGKPTVIVLDQGARRIVRDDAGRIVGTEPVPENAASAATTPRSLARKATSPPDDGSYPPAA
jgi:hypothetical protein